MPRVCGLGVAEGDHNGRILEWPRFSYGEYRQRHEVGWSFAGDTFLELSVQEIRALRVITLQCKVAKEKYGGPHHFN